MRRVIAFAFVVSFLGSSLVHAAPLTVDSGRSFVQFTSKAPFETVIGKTSDVSGEIHLSRENLRSVSGTIRVQAASLKTGNRLRDKNMREDYLETDKFPSIVFQIERVVSRPTAVATGREGSYTLEGAIEIHGVRKKLTVPATVSIEQDGGIKVESDFVTGLSDFQIKRPSFLIMRLAEEVTVKVKLALGRGSHKSQVTSLHF